ncbi:MAG: hypothetical protein WEF28_03230, partial [Acidimicrobiia bacterium]
DDPPVDNHIAARFVNFDVDYDHDHHRIVDHHHYGANDHDGAGNNDHDGAGNDHDDGGDHNHHRSGIGDPGSAQPQGLSLLQAPEAAVGSWSPS